MRYGPYGSSSPQNFDWQLLHGERFIRVSIRHGWIVDAIGFRARRPDGGNRDVHFGGNGGNQSHVNTHYLIFFFLFLCYNYISTLNVSF